MKFKDVCKQYNLDVSDFDYFLRWSIAAEEFRPYLIDSSNLIYPHYLEIEDGADIEKMVKCYRNKDKLNAEKAEQKRIIAEKKAAAEKAKRIALSKMLITSGFNFDGYKITKYSGYISGDDAVQIPRTGWFGSSETNTLLTDALVKIRRQAIAELKEAAYDLGCNAVIGVDFDYITMDPQTAGFTGNTVYEPYVICVTANGNAVIIEKKEE